LCSFNLAEPISTISKAPEQKQMARKTVYLYVGLSTILMTTAIRAQQPATDQTQTSDQISARKFDQQDKFRQLEEILPTANSFRTASGAPGPAYWQQKVDYEIDVRLDDTKQHIYGSEKIKYKNNSKDPLRYLWLQLDGNIHRQNAEGILSQTAGSNPQRGVSFRQLEGLLLRQVFDGGFNIDRVCALSNEKPLKFTVVKTMMRVDLPQPLQPGEWFHFQVDWNYAINNARVVRGRSGFEFFPEDGNYIYEMAQWFPRLCAYTDSTGWQHKQFLGRGEFTLEMGDYVAKITVPEDHVVASTGTLLNPDQVLTEAQRERLAQAKSAKKPVFIVTPDEAKANEKSKPAGTKTWVFKADMVRDFAWASSRKFIWDALQHNQNGNPVMAMSFYPNAGEPLWSKYSTQAIIHTLNVYSRYTFDYPYPVAISVNGPVGGMEYPMICFNGPRPEKDGTYSARTKYGLISVIIHEVGHNYFPMIVNSDERQWTWMDEGLNTFLQYLAEQEWEDQYPSRRGEPKNIVEFMKSVNQVPIMTNSESLLQFGNNAYAKPATALNILRETILGRELFDFAFKEYARRWRFKRPMPADFFRTMEDASGVDLDWFWRGWFYSTDHVDIGIKSVRHLNIDSQNPDVEKQLQKNERDSQPKTLSGERNRSLPKRANQFPDLKDFYNSFDPLDVTESDRTQYKKFLESLTDTQKKLLQSKQNFYLVEFENAGGLVMPIIFDLHFVDGSKKSIRLPVEIWNKNNERVTKLLMTEKEVKRIQLDPRLETADTEIGNNNYPRQIQQSRFKLFKQQRRGSASGVNPMQMQNKIKGAKK
jgi:hypothetical protein